MPGMWNQRNLIVRGHSSSYCPCCPRLPVLFQTPCAIPDSLAIASVVSILPEQQELLAASTVAHHKQGRN